MVNITDRENPERFELRHPCLSLVVQKFKYI